MIRLPILMVSGALWALMMFLLFEREIQPYFEYHKPPSYRMMLGGKTRAEAQYRVITLGAEQIGEAETVTEPLGAQGFRTRTRFVMNMRKLVPLPLRDDRVAISSDVQVDESYHLSRFRMEGWFQGVGATVKGQRWGSKLRIVYILAGMRREQMVDFPSEATLSDNFLPYLGGARLEVGRKWRMPQVDWDRLILPDRNPSLCRDVYAAVVGRESLRYGDRDVPVFRVEVRKNPNDETAAYTLLVDDEGEVLEQTMTPARSSLPCVVTLRERRFLEDAEAAAYLWRVEMKP